ncbi:MAG TPA: DUF1653 domain-containing protein [Clostridiales bacterium UBA8960]|jgi:hypothetical protein|nr:DUF1653 domain-containing protein [Clostridiales bacterium UBA8960]
MHEEIIIGGTYKHFKGNLYKVLAIAKHSETEELMVVYQKLYGDHDTWVRPYDMFVDMKEIDGKMIKRFEWVD